MLKGYPVCQKMMPKGPDQVSICDELEVRMCWHLSYRHEISNYQLVEESCGITFLRNLTMCMVDYTFIS